jgi:hypothetical protein
LAVILSEAKDPCIASLQLLVLLSFVQFPFEQLAPVTSPSRRADQGRLNIHLDTELLSFAETPTKIIFLRFLPKNRMSSPKTT